MRWWHLAEQWLQTAEDLPHGSVEPALVRFAAARKRKPISVRKAVAAYRFIQSSRELQSAEVEKQLASLPLEAVETLQRLSRYKQADLSDLIAKVLAGSLRGEALEIEELRIRTEAQATSEMSEDAHAFRLRAGPFRTFVQSRLARLFPPPTTCVSAHALASNRLLACDSWARGPAGYAGIKIIATCWAGTGPLGGGRCCMRGWPSHVSTKSFGTCVSITRMPKSCSVPSKK